jgi:hypothetical protein
MVFLGCLQLKFRDYYKLYGLLRSLKLSYGYCPKITRLRDLPQGSHSGSRIPILVGRIEENTASLCGVWGALCLHTSPTESKTRKGMNFGMHHHIRVPRLSLSLNIFIYVI